MKYNYMTSVASILGVNIGEKFILHGDHDGIIKDKLFTIDCRGLIDELGIKHNYTLILTLIGEYTVEKVDGNKKEANDDKITVKEFYDEKQPKHGKKQYLYKVKQDCHAYKSNCRLCPSIEKCSDIANNLSVLHFLNPNEWKKKDIKRIHKILEEEERNGK